MGFSLAAFMAGNIPKNIPTDDATNNAAAIDHPSTAEGRGVVRERILAIKAPIITPRLHFTLHCTFPLLDACTFNLAFARNNLDYS
jgi:hypothetical protein